MTVALGGVIVPEGVPTTAVTVCVTMSAAKFAVTVQSAVIGPVVYVSASVIEPPQPVTVSMWKPLAGARSKLVVAPSATVTGAFGVIAPEGVPTTGVTVCGGSSPSHVPELVYSTFRSSAKNVLPAV